MRVRMPNGKHPKVSLVSGVLVTVFGALAPVGGGTIAAASSQPAPSPFLLEAFSPAELGLSPETG